MLILLNFSFRDGVSEGQFYQVLLYELDAIRKVGQTSYFPFVNLLTTFVELTNVFYCRHVHPWNQITSLL
jgi:hypothetical protein